MRTTLATLSLVALAAIGGCATTSYGYSPLGANGWVDGYPSAAVDVPLEAPQGRVELTSFGVVGITPDGAGSMTVLHVRLAVTNDGDDQPWSISTSDQIVEIDGRGRSGPIYVNTDVPGATVLPIERRARRVLDLYYPLPPGVDEEELPTFELLWQVTTAARPFASRTRFGRIEDPEPRGTVILYTGWGPYWWYDPLYPRHVFVHHRTVVRPRSDVRVIVHRPPPAHRPRHRDHRR